ncbi:MAG: polymerase subunit sigma-70 [Bradyrhizobium sp.]|nr:polymerase subunit sigma-70 [Bradyrhizobium sp.]
MLEADNDVGSCCFALVAGIPSGVRASRGYGMTAPGSSRAEKREGASAAAGSGASGGVELELLYRNEKHALVRFFTRYRASRDEAQDLVQETFLRLTRVDLDGPGRLLRPAAYLRQIARNLLIDRAKAARRHFAEAHICADDVSLAGIDEHQRLEARDSLVRLEAAIRRLKPKTREIFLAYHVEGLGYAEIAARTGLSVSGVEKQMGRAFDHIHRLTGLP